MFMCQKDAISSHRDLYTNLSLPQEHLEMQ